MTDTTNINLIPQKSFEEQPAKKKFFLWVVGVGRVIVITTELIAILVWLSRFRLDYEITTLQENIEEKAALVATTSRFEKSFSKYVTKVEFVKQIDQDKAHYSRGISKLSDLSPSDILLTSLDLTDDNIGLRAYTPSGLSFSNFIAALIGSEDITQVKLTSSRFDKSNGSYLITLELTANEGIYSK